MINFKEMAESHGILLAERDVCAAEGDAAESEARYHQRVASAIRQGRDPLSHLSMAALAIGRQIVDPVLDAARQRASAAYQVDFLLPAQTRASQAREQARTLNESARKLWGEIENKHPAKAEQIFVKAVQVTQDEATRTDQALAELSARVQRARMARHDNDHAASLYAQDVAKALVNGGPLPAPPVPTEAEEIDEAAIEQAQAVLMAQQTKASEVLREARENLRAFRPRRERAAAGEIAAQASEQARNLKVQLHLVAAAISEVRS